MPDITPTYAPAIGDTFDADAWNQQLYDVTTDNSFEVLNGRIESANLHADTRLRPQHIRKGQLVTAESVGGTESLDFYSEVFEGVERFYVALPGASKTFYQRWDAGTCLVHFSAFFSAWLWNDGSYQPEIWTALYVDGVEVTNTRRKMPTTVHYNSDVLNWLGAHPNVEGAWHFEAFSTRQRAQHHHIANLPKGEHTISVRIWVQNLHRSLELDRGFAVPAASHSQLYLPYERLTAGVRSLTVLRAL